MPIEPCAEAPSVDADERVALFRLVLLQRLFEDRVMALYRQGRIPGSVYTGRGQEAVAAGAGLALGPDDVVAPLNRELACHFARGATPADVFRNFFGKATSPTFGRDGNMHFGAPARGVFPLVSMLGDLVPCRCRRGARVQAARRASSRDDVPRRRCLLGRRHARGAEPRSRLAGARCLRDPVESLLLLDACRAPDGEHEHRPADLRRLVDSRRARRRNRRPCRSRHRACCRRAGAQRQRPPGRRGPLGADARPRRPRRRALHAGRDARGVRRALRPGGTTRSTPRARRLRLRAIQGMRDAALAEVDAGLAEAEQAPAPDPATLEDGVYAAPPF